MQVQQSPFLFVCVLMHVSLRVCVHVLFVAEKAVSRVIAAGIRMASQVSEVLYVSVGIGLFLRAQGFNHKHPWLVISPKRNWKSSCYRRF